MFLLNTWCIQCGPHTEACRGSNGFKASLNSSAFETYTHLKCQRYQGLAQTAAHMVFQWLHQAHISWILPTYSVRAEKKKKPLLLGCLWLDSEVTCHPSFKNKMALVETLTALSRQFLNWHSLIEELPGRQIQLPVSFLCFLLRQPILTETIETQLQRCVWSCEWGLI